MSPAETDSIQQAHAIGQSFWLDYIRRDLVEQGELERLIAAGEIRGVTSNPSIFEQAIGRSDLYDAPMRPLAHAGWSADRIFEKLAVHDIRAATDLFLPLYEGTGGRDGFVSIEVNPQLANDTQATLEEARRLWEAVNRPNLMVKIPATPAGIPAIEQAIAEAINVNVTLIFALDRYAEVMQAYLRGLERRTERGQPLDRIASVASFFVSRVDSAVDRRLEEIVREEGRNAPRAAALLGRAAVANAKLAYAQFKSTFGEPRFSKLQQRGARVQRPLWASTSTKNPAYSDVLYVEELIGPDTVNTLPPKTLTTFRQHGEAEPRLERDLSEARAQLEAIEGLGVSLAEITSQLEREGVEAFAASYRSLIEIVAQRASQMRAEIGVLQPQLGPLLDELEHERVAARYWRADPSLWPKDGEVWVRDLAAEWETQWPEVERALGSIDAHAATRIGWLGASVARLPLESSVEHRQLETLDPVEQRMFRSETPIESTLFVAATAFPRDPSVEAELELTWSRAANRLGEGAARRFLIVGPAGSELTELARSRGLPNLNVEPDLAGAAAAVALSGSGAAAPLESATQLRERCAPNYPGAENPGMYLGALLALAEQAGLRRLGLLTDAPQARLADWLAHRFEASGLGATVAALRQLPVGSGVQDRLLVYLRSSGEHDSIVDQWIAAGEPAVLLEADSGAGGEAVRWEMALDIAAHVLGRPPHPAPVEQGATGRWAQAELRSRKKGRLRGPKPTMQAGDGAAWWSVAGGPVGDADSVYACAAALARRLHSGSMLNLAILRRRSKALDRAIEAAQSSLGKRGVDLRVSYGRPPWTSGAASDSNWQVHLLLNEAPKQDEPIPGSPMTFGELQLLQAWAVLEELQSRRLEVGLLRLAAPATVVNWLRTLIRELDS